MNTQSTLPDLIALIYEAAGEPSLWPGFLQSCGRVLHTEPNALWFQDLASGHEQMLGYVGADPAFVRSYAEYYRTRNFYISRIQDRVRRATVCTDEALCPRQEAVKSEFWNDWIAPQGLRDALFGILRSDGVMGFMCLDRGTHDPPFDGHDQRVAQQLMPHLQRAIQLHLRISKLDSQLRAARDVLNRWPLGVILIDSKGSVLLMNRCAEAILNQKDGLVFDRRELRAARSNETAVLRRLIRGAIQVSLGGNGGPPGGVVSLPRPSCKRPFSVLVTPACKNPLHAPVSGAAAVVFVSDPEIHPESHPDMLQRLYGLTAREAEVAMLLMRGSSPEEAAGNLSVTRNDVRFHLKHILEKTGTHRQSELIRLIMASPAELQIADDF